MQSFLGKYSQRSRYTYSQSQLSWLYLCIPEPLCSLLHYQFVFPYFPGKGTRFHRDCTIYCYNAGTSVYEPTNLWASSSDNFLCCLGDYWALYCTILILISFCPSPLFQLTSFHRRLPLIAKVSVSSWLVLSWLDPFTISVWYIHLPYQ